MKIKYILLLITSLFFSVITTGQHQLYFETFKGTNSFMLNDTGFGSNSGNNKWIVDTNYFAGGIYPKTINEDSTYGGTISYAPYSNYLHIYDSATAHLSGYLNDNYTPNDSSTRFAHMTSGICTKALTNINFNFFYLCPSITSYGVVVYSINGAPWITTGDTLRNRRKWQYATITNPAFTNVEDLKFGFLWHNNKATSLQDSTGLGVDDISLFGTYDSIAHPIKCMFTTIPVLTDSCLGSNASVYFSATLTDSTCSAIWDVYMSDGSGNFPGSYAWYTTIGPNNFNDITSYWYLTPPSGFATVGHCYRFKMERTTYPFLAYLDSVCFPFDSCPGTITTLEPPPVLDTNPICAGSVIDVPFYSTGIYGIYNNYYAQLIDSVGSSAIIDTIGYLASNIAYPYPPGDIVSTIPTKVPAGCKYYVQVVSTTANRKPTIYGPFCIQHCDILTNNQQSLQACLQGCKKQPQGYSDTIIYKTHKFDSLAHYHKGNKFKVQLIQFALPPFTSFGAINTGLLGAVVDTVTGKLRLHVPCPDTLFANGINPGVYYARVIADSSNYTDSSFGSLIHLTIGEPADSLYLTMSPLTGPYCSTSTLSFYANPNQSGPPYNSTYNWWEKDARFGTSPFSSVTTAYLGLNSGADTFHIVCQENNYGCLGTRTTLPDTVIVIGPPNITPTGPTYVCLTDTGKFSIPFANNTNYSWKISAPAHADTSNNVLKIKFNAVGTAKISVVAFNTCFTDSAVWNVHVIATPVPVIKAVPSTPVCEGTPITLSATGGTTYKWNNGKTGPSIVVIPSKDTTYWVAASNKGCTVNDNIKLLINPKPAVNITLCIGDTITMKATGANTYNWSPSSGLTIHDSIAKTMLSSTQTYTVIGTNHSNCTDTTSISVDPNNKTFVLSSAPSGQGVQLSAKGGTSYFWSPSTGLNCDTCASPFATPQITTIYTVTIKNNSGCSVTDTITAEATGDCTIFIPDAFTPGNPNNQNTILYIRSECLALVDFKIFDRWGNEVFESTNINQGWDGTFKGQPMNTATFVYYVNGTSVEGKTVTKKGNVALVR